MSAPDTSSRLARAAELTQELGGAVTCDGLTRDFVIFQRRRGHRHSTDDLLTAWYAALHAPRLESPRLLDLGSGIGSIGLALAWRFPASSLTAVEAQGVSHRLLRANIEANGVSSRTRALLGDLRDTSLGADFDLVTGSPPYFNVKDGIVSADSQRAHARFELRGDIGDYARAAVRAMAPAGRFVFCFPENQKSRAVAACTAAGLSLLRIRDVIPKEGADALFSLFACAHRADAGPAPTTVDPPFVVRDAEGRHTRELTEVRGLFGMGSPP